MIELKVESYCEDCADFKPVSESICYYAEGVVAQVNTTVTCKYGERCKRIHKMLMAKTNAEVEE